jgi:FlaG/FlaF family flagellin (archaellin)
MRRRGVSDVVATILILALTVTLFASIFAFVGSFPHPPAQNTNQFQASLGLTSNQTYIQNLTITHLSGPVVSPSARIYLESVKSTSNWQFASSQNGVPVAWGLNPANSSTGWNLGQTWTTTFSQPIKIPDNITVFITSSGQLLYTTVLPGVTISLPPAIVTIGVTPAIPTEGGAFQIYASVAGNFTGGSLTVALGGIPGLSGTPKMVSYLGQYVYNVSAGKTTGNGTFYAFLNATNALGQSASASIGITISGTSGGGGGGSSSSLSVVVGMSAQPPPTLTTQTYFWAAVTDPNSGPATVNITFWVNETPGSQFPGGAKSYKFYGGSSPSITGPSTVTVYSNGLFPGASQGWLFGSAITVQALASVSGVGDATGSTSFTTGNFGITGEVCVSATSNSCSSPVTSFTHESHASCGSSGHGSTPCPYIVVQVNDSSSSAISYSGIVWANTSSTHSGSFTVSSTSVSAGSSTATDAPTGTQWTPTVTGTYTVYAWLTVTAGGTTIGYIYATFQVTVN